MFDISIHIYLASPTRWIHLTRQLEMPAVPRVGEFLKLHNDRAGDSFAWKVSQVTHHESGVIEVMTELLEDVGGRGYTFEEEDEFDECVAGYTDFGWSSPRGVRPNPRMAQKEH